MTAKALSYTQRHCFMWELNIFNFKSQTGILQLSGEERSCNEGIHVSGTDRRNVIQLLQFGWFCCYVKRHVCRVRSEHSKTSVWFYSVISDAAHAARTKQFLSSWQWLLSKQIFMTLCSLYRLDGTVFEPRWDGKRYPLFHIHQNHPLGLKQPSVQWAQTFFQGLKELDDDADRPHHV